MDGLGEVGSSLRYDSRGETYEVIDGDRDLLILL